MHTIQQEHVAEWVEHSLSLFFMKTWKLTFKSRASPFDPPIQPTYAIACLILPSFLISLRN